MPRRIILIAIAAAALLVAFGAVGATADAAAAKGGKIRGCVAKKGELKGYVRISKGKCNKGEKKVVWSKKGKRGKRGPEGPKGQDGKDGANSSVVDDLVTQLQQQASAIEALRNQVTALCTQAAAVTSQLDALGGVVSGIGLGGTIPPLLTLVVPTVPTPLGTFGCPSG